MPVTWHAAEGAGEAAEAPVKRKVVYGRKKPAAKKPDAAAQEAEAAAEQAEAEKAAAAEEACRLQEAAEQQRLAEAQAVRLAVLSPGSCSCVHGRHASRAAVKCQGKAAGCCACPLLHTHPRHGWRDDVSSALNGGMLLVQSSLQWSDHTVMHLPMLAYHSVSFRSACKIALPLQRLVLGPDGDAECNNALT